MDQMKFSTVLMILQPLWRLALNSPQDQFSMGMFRKIFEVLMELAFVCMAIKLFLSLQLFLKATIDFSLIFRWLWHILLHRKRLLESVFILLYARKNITATSETFFAYIKQV
jgi:hypothetical protein